MIDISEVKMEFTEEAKYQLVNDYITDSFPNELFQDHTFANLVKRISECRQFNDNSDFGYHIRYAIVLKTKFNVSDRHIIEAMTDNTILDKIFNKVIETEYFKQLMDKAPIIHLVKDPITGEFKEPVMH